MSKRTIYTHHDLAKFIPALVLAWISEQTTFKKIKLDVLLDGHDKPWLKEPIKSLLNSGYLRMTDQGQYQVTKAGQEEINRIEALRGEIAKRFFVFDGVNIVSDCTTNDLRDQFAFRQFFDFRSSDDWRNTVRINPDYKDLRLTVIDYLARENNSTLTVLDVLFTVFLVDRKFRIEDDNWSLDLIDGSIWNEILEIANTFIIGEQIATGENSIKEIIKLGFEVAQELSRKEEELHNQRQQQDETYEPSYFTEPVEYYEVVEIVEEEEVIVLPDPFLTGILVGAILF